MSMKRIETIDDLLKWAREVNQGVTIHRKVELQDIYARSQRETLDQLFIDSGTDRKLILCSVNNTMAFEEVERLLLVLAHDKLKTERRELYREIDKREERISQRENALADAKKPIYKHLASLHEQIKSLNRRLEIEEGKSERFKALAKDYAARSVDDHEKAKKYDQIKAALV